MQLFGQFDTILFVNTLFKYLLDVIAYSCLKNNRLISCFDHNYSKSKTYYSFQHYYQCAINPFHGRGTNYKPKHNGKDIYNSKDNKAI